MKRLATDASPGHQVEAVGPVPGAEWPLEEGPAKARARHGGQPVQVVAPHHGPRDAAVRRLLALADLGGVLIALALATSAVSRHHRELLWALPFLPFWVVIFKAYGLYDRDTKRIGHATIDDLPWILHGVLLGSVLMLVFFRLASVGSFDLGDLAVFAAIATLGIATLRASARRLAVGMLGPERLLLVGDGPQIATLARKLESHPEYGVQVIGAITHSTDAVLPTHPPVLGSISELDLNRLVASHGVERLVVAHEDFEGSALFDLLHRCRELNVKVSVLPQLFDALGPSVELDDVEGVTVLGVNPPVLPRSSRLLKRTIDLVGSAVLLVLTAPLHLAIAIAVKLDTPGPVFFRQERIGRCGRRFRLIKFRTMALDAEERRAALLAASKDPNWLLIDEDPRITRVGRFLRVCSLDELPQLWNVLRGEMSLVGPRPIIEDEDRRLEGWRRSRIDLTPGITGLWQVLGRTNISFEEMVKLDYLYVTNWSLWTDLRLVLRTLPAVLLRRGAN
jgi:exopolysaccharide biosynthesis polyprenyl glycosylphosphotransferase